jgi:hypothetical protein
VDSLACPVSPPSRLRAIMRVGFGWPNPAAVVKITTS